MDRAIKAWQARELDFLEGLVRTSAFPLALMLSSLLQTNAQQTHFHFIARTKTSNGGPAPTMRSLSPTSRKREQAEEAEEKRCRLKELRQRAKKLAEMEVRASCGALLSNACLLSAGSAGSKRQACS